MKFPEMLYNSAKWNEESILEHKREHISGLGTIHFLLIYDYCGNSFENCKFEFDLIE